MTRLSRILFTSGLAVVALLIVAPLAWAEKIEPPWETPPYAGKHFTVPTVDNVPDLHGQVENPDLVVFFAGNQFMVVNDLLDAFRKAHPEYERIYVETLPPGILADQIEQGALVVGNLQISVKPDVYTAGKGRIERMQKEKGWFSRTVDYARNRLAIMVPSDNPAKVESLEDLGRPNVKVSMPNPKWEGIGKHIEAAMKKAGGQSLVDRVMQKKVENGTTFLTHIHHRQTPIRIMKGESQAGPVWFTECAFQEMIGNPIKTVEIPAKHNVEVTYTAASMLRAPHAKAAKDFLDFLVSDAGQAVYRKHHFLPASH